MLFRSVSGNVSVSPSAQLGKYDTVFGVVHEASIKAVQPAINRFFKFISTLFNKNRCKGTSFFPNNLHGKRKKRTFAPILRNQDLGLTGFD